MIKNIESVNIVVVGMINKFLCRMWGHVCVEVDMYLVVTYQQFFKNDYDKNKCKTAFIVYKCKHCEASYD